LWREVGGDEFVDVVGVSFETHATDVTGGDEHTLRTCSEEVGQGDGWFDSTERRRADGTTVLHVPGAWSTSSLVSCSSRLLLSLERSRNGGLDPVVFLCPGKEVR